ncbi:hypothetical protein [Xanthobacter flavus]|uniref:hypothetical protein n=1 Tax=Xanthobacter flavus TaxID=281 RepID=UPI003729B4B6
MAISYPRPFPSGMWFASGTEFKLGDKSVQNTLESGAIQTMEIAPSLWSAKFVTPGLLMHDRQVWQAWELTLRGGRTFLAYDPEKVYPKAYRAGVLALTRAGGGAFDGTATLASVAATSVSVTGLPAGYMAKVGDMLSFPWNNVHALHQIVEDATANGAGAATFRVWPPVQTSPAPAGGSTVRLVQPWCVMKIKPGTFTAPASSTNGTAPVSFEGVQDISGKPVADF